MGSRLRRRALAALVGAILVVPATAFAAEFSSCWTARETNPDTGFSETVTRCRISGGSTVDFPSDPEVPSTLYPNLGTDLVGPCWYLTSIPTMYIIITRYVDGSADIGYDPDPSIPGGIIVVGPNMERCSSEPTPGDDPVTDAWNYAMAYIHDPPTPDLNPEPGEGVTGLDTFLGVVVPEDHDGTLTSGATTLEVEIDVDAVIVDWGDGGITTYPPDETILAGYPDGSATHTYETKDADGVALVVEYDWTARWRFVGGTWTPLPVPNTETAVVYPIAEVVSRLDG